MQNIKDWSLVAEYTNHALAEYAKNLLEQHRIPVSIWSDDCGGWAAGQTFIQRVRVFVPDAARKKALDILGRGEDSALES